MKKVRAVAMPEEAPELVLDQDFRNPQPLDQRIASVWLRTPTNNVTDGYDLLLSASFGKERVTLKGGGFEIEFDFSLTSADIEIKGFKCSTSVIEDERIEDARTTIKDQTSHGTKYKATGVGGELSVNALTGTGGKGRVSGEYEKSGSHMVTTQRQTQHMDYQRIGSNTIKVGPTGDVLNGRLIHDFKGWRVTPGQKTTPSAVAAQLKVREQWIKFEMIDFIATPERFIDRIKDFMNRSDRRRRDCFRVLLTLLAQSGLSGFQDGRAATIAVDVLMVKPNEPQAASLPSGPSSHEIRINADPLVDFLSSPEGHEASTLIGLGVKAEMISPVVQAEEHVSGRGKFFIPESAPPDALEVLEQIHEAGYLEKDEVKHPTTLHDLRALKLIMTNELGHLELVSNSLVATPEMLMRRAVSAMECIKVARAVMTINPGAKAVEIADAVSLELGKNWTNEGTKRRNGNAIKRWLIWLEPHVLDPDESVDAAARLTMLGKSIVGRHSLRGSVKDIILRGSGNEPPDERGC